MRFASDRRGDSDRSVGRLFFDYVVLVASKADDVFSKKHL